MPHRPPPHARSGPSIRIARSETVDPTKLSPGERSSLIDELFDLIVDVFDGVTDEKVATEVVESSADWARILVHRGERNELLGFFALYFHERLLHGRPVVVVRAKAGLRRHARGQDTIARWGLRTLLAQKLAHPTKPFFGLAAMVHPSGHMQIARYFPGGWPTHANPPPPDVLQFMLELADAFEMEIVDPARPLIRKVGFAVRESDAERRYWRRVENPDARFFVDMIPSYDQSHGLLTLVPFDAAALVHLAREIANEKTSYELGRALLTMERWPGVSRLFAGRAARTELAASPGFRELDRTSIEAIAAHATVRAYRRATSLFREGDEIDRDALHLVSRGAVSVTVSRPEGEAIVEQLGPGALIRTERHRRHPVSMRTVGKTTLVEIAPGPLWSLAEKDARVAAAVQAALAAHTRVPSPPLEEGRSSRSERHARVEQANAGGALHVRQGRESAERA